MTKKGRREQKGSSLILVVCVMAFVTAVCLMILLTVYSLNRRMKLAEYREQCRIMAESVNLWISDELTTPIYRERPKDPEASLFDYAVKTMEWIRRPGVSFCRQTMHGRKREARFI